MAYVDKELSAKIRKNLKRKFPLKDGYKFSVSGAGTGRVKVTVLRLPFEPTINGEPVKHSTVNPYHYKSHGYDEDTTRFITKVKKIVTEDHWDESDPMIDYFNCAYYYSISLGRYNRDIEIC